MLRSAVFLVALTLAPAALAEPQKSNVDYRGFQNLTEDVQLYRQSRLLDLTAWKALAARKDALILDARSADKYAAGHIEGAVNLPFTDFTAADLARVIGDPSRPILIYCNNNFQDDAPPVILKAAPLALNIPTFINLYGYGYKNVWELSEKVSMKDPRVGWVKS